MHSLVSLQRTNIKPNDYLTYLRVIEEEYNQIKDFLPKKIETVLDIGCGLGGIDIFLYRDFKPEIIFLDRDGVDKKIVYGFNQTSSKYNLLSETKEFVEPHGVKNAKYINIDQNQFPKKEVDLTISLLAMGYHFPFDTYQPKTKYLIADIRNGLPISYSWKIIYHGKNFKRVLIEYCN